MKRILFIYILFFAQQVYSKTYYVKAAGGTGTGTSDATAWSFTRLHVITLSPGDTVLFNRGDTFSGGIPVQPGSSGKYITYGAYGTGANPIFTSLATVTGWTQLSGNVYYAPLTMAGLNVVMMDGNNQGMGRYPKTGYLTYTAFSGYTSLTGAKLPFNPTGGDCVIRKIRQVTDRQSITGYSNGVLTLSAISNFGTVYTNSTNYFPTAGNGYFIQNNLNCVTQNGEWFHDESTNRLYMYFADGNPNAHSIQYASQNTLIEMDNYNYVNFFGLDFVGANYNCVNTNNNTYITFTNCNFYHDFTGIYSDNGMTNLTITGGSFHDLIDDGILIPQLGSNITITGTAFNNIGIIPGAGNSGDAQQLGMWINGSGNDLIQYCSVTNIGYHGIVCYGNNTLVQYNYVDTFGLVKDDCGGIYDSQFQGIVNSNKIIRNNIILNGIGVAAGAPAYNPYGEAAGIYLDNTNNVQVTNNSIAHTNWGGVIIIGSSANNQIINNHIFDAAEQLYLVNIPQITKLTVTGNQFVAKTVTESTEYTDLFATTDNLTLFGTFNNNIYARPFNDTTTITIHKNYAGGGIANISLNTWKSSYKLDLLSKTSPVIYPSYYVQNTIGSNLFSNTGFNSTINGVQITGSGSIAWALNSSFSGGTLKAVNTNTSYVTIPIGEVDSTKQYDLKFTALSSQAANIKAYLRQTSSPNAVLSSISTLKLTSALTQYECLFSFPKSENNASLVLESDSQALTYWIDNVQLYQANVIQNLPDNFIYFYYNASTSPKTIQLSTSCVDPTNVSYSGSVVLQPYTSIILMNAYCVQPATPTISTN